MIKITLRTVGKVVVLCIPCYLFDAFAETASTGYSNQQDATVAPSNIERPAEPAESQDFYTRSQNIDSLLFAYRVIAIESGREEQLNVLERAVSNGLQQAKALYRMNKVSEGRDILDGLYDDVKKAIIQLRDGKTVSKSRAAGEQYDIRNTPPQHARETGRLTDSIDTLMVAHHRVSSEKGQQQHALAMRQKIATIKSVAARQFGEGDYRAGNELLNGAYILLQEALISLRDGDTLVQSLDFADIIEEFQYYQRKTQSQITAIKTLLTIIDDEAKKDLLNRLLARAQRSLDEASSLANKNRYEVAVPIMDEVFTRLQSGLMISLSVQQ